MLKSALINMVGALSLAAAVVATAATAPVARADWICDNCNCKCGRCHSIARGIYCCPCVKTPSKPSNSTPHPKIRKRSLLPSTQDDKVACSTEHAS